MKGRLVNSSDGVVHPGPVGVRHASMKGRPIKNGDSVTSLPVVQVPVLPR
jgi:hypothetical protein